MKLQKSVRLYTDKHFENIGNIFTNLYEDSLLTDCILYCKDGSLKAHKVILAASSRYFRQVFVEHSDDNAIFMYGISYSQLKNLIELIYRGSIDIPNENFDSVYGLCEELKITGVNIESTEIQTVKMEVMLSVRGKKLIIVDKYTFRKERETVIGVSYRCTNAKCPARIAVDKTEEILLEKKNSHNHSQSSNIDVKKLQNGIKRKAVDDLSERPSEILSSGIKKEGPDFNITMKDLENIKKSMYRARRKKTNGTGRDTRYKGQKRVAVDFESKDGNGNENALIPSTATKNSSDRRDSSSSEKSQSQKESEIETDAILEESEPLILKTDAILQETEPLIIKADEAKDDFSFVDQDGLDDHENLSVWARKERKFKCDLCPSSFKRASHLNRHQLVHTGERPFACDQCDKAFSRHDKLKHHVHKTHELGALNEALGPDSLYTIDRVDILTPETSVIETENVVPVEPTISISPIEFSEPPMKRRGRPRKHPPPIKPLVKRPRGRPRIKPEIARPLMKRPRGRPRVNPVGGSMSRGAYHYRSSNFDSVGYLPKSHPTPSELESSQEMISDLGNDVDMMDHEQGIMEPLVEINTEADICSSKSKEGIQPQTSTNSFFENIGLFENTTTIAKIGECTISVATTCPNVSASNTGGHANN